MVTKVREWQRKILALGLCQACRQPRKKYKSLCDDCMDIHRVRMKKRMREKRLRDKIAAEACNKLNDSVS